MCVMLGLKDSSVNVQTSHHNKQFVTLGFLPQLGQKPARLLGQGQPTLLPSEICDETFQRLNAPHMLDVFVSKCFYDQSHRNPSPPFKVKVRSMWGLVVLTPGKQSEEGAQRPRLTGIKP